MKSLPTTLNKVIEAFSRFPGIGKKTAQKFIKEYGWPSKTDPESLVFGGRTYKTNNPKEGLELLVNAPATTDKSIPSIGLYRSEDGLLVAGWSFQKLHRLDLPPRGSRPGRHQDARPAPSDQSLIR